MSVMDLFPGSETGSEQSAALVSLDSVTAVSLLLVELISPDVMYNGLPWPEEEFCKVHLQMCKCWLCTVFCFSMTVFSFFLSNAYQLIAFIFFFPPNEAPYNNI
jgi:hypothetical protein